MLNKLLVLAVPLFLFFLLLGYDQVVNDEGGVGPITKIARQVRSAYQPNNKKVNDFFPREKIKEFDANIERLNSIRDGLLLERERTLGSLIANFEDYGRTVRIYLDDPAFFKDTLKTELEDVLESIRTMEYEYQIFLKNAKVTEDKLKDIFQPMNSQFDAIGEKLLDITKEETLELLNEYFSYQADIDLNVGNLEKNVDRIHQQFADISVKLKSSFDDLAGSSSINSSSFQLLYNEMKEKQQVLELLFEKNEALLHDNFKEQMFEHEKFLEGLLNAGEISLDALQGDHSEQDKKNLMELKDRLSHLKDKK